MEHNISSIASDTPARMELARFLAGFEGETRGEAFWLKRLAFWWDENPFCTPDLPKGWGLRSKGAIVGFLGVIPFEYMHRGQVYRALAATTWRVAETHRNASLPLFLQWHRLGREFILLDTTANTDVARILDRFHYQVEGTVTHHLFPLTGSPGLKGLALVPPHWINRLSLPRQSIRVVKLNDSFEIHQSIERQDRLEKRVTVEYLRWYCNSPGTQKDFWGCVNERGALTSYLVIQPEAYGPREVLSVIDYFTTRATWDELLALLRHVLGTSRTPEWSRLPFLLFNVLGENHLKPGFIHRKDAARHYYSLPKRLEGVPKRCVLAEGDYGC